MDGQIKKIKDVFPVTTSKAVYIDGTDKTLQEAIDNGELGGTTVTTASNFITDVCLYVDDIIFTLEDDSSITLTLNTEITLNRIIKVFWSNGSVSNASLTSGINIPDGSALLWNNTDGFYLVESMYSNAIAPYNGFVVGANLEGRIVFGILKDIWNKYYPYYNSQNPKYKATYNVNVDLVEKEVNKTLHSMYVCNDQLITLECYTSDGVWNGASHVYSLPDLTYQKTFYNNLQGVRSDGDVINLRLVCADYCSDNDCLLLASGTADDSDNENWQGYIFYEASGFPDYEEAITFENAPNTILDFYTNKPLGDISCPKAIWSELPDIIYLTTNNFERVFKILLGVGTTQLENGIYEYDEKKRYNGTWKLLESYKQPTVKYGNKDIHLYKGCAYYPLKYTSGGLRVLRSYFTVGGTMEHDLILYNPVDETGTTNLTGSPEGCVVYDGKLICGHATYGYFYIFDLNNL